jgi:hypothetical protein
MGSFELPGATVRQRRQWLIVAMSVWGLLVVGVNVAALFLQPHVGRLGLASLPLTLVTLMLAVLFNRWPAVRTGTVGVVGETLLSSTAKS